MGALLFSIATSDLALSIDAVVFVAALLIAGVDRLAKWFPWIKPYTAWGRPVSYVALALLMWFGGARWTDESAEVKALQNQLAAKSIDLKAASSSAIMAADARNELAAKAASDEKRISDYAEALKARPNAACILTPDDFDRRVRE